MWRTVIFLIIALILVPIATYFLDVPLDAKQYEVLRVLVITYLIAAGLCFVISTISSNFSQVDKLWSVIPIVYAWTVVYYYPNDGRLILMASLVTIWGARLTYNFARRGGYSWKFWEGEEDYRWAVLRSKPEFKAPWKWFLFNLFFISLYQMGLILLFTLPILKAATNTPLGIADWILALLFVGLVIFEAVSDQQQWVFQNEKYRLKTAGEPMSGEYADGFLQSGLWGILRHPNYAAEQAIWVVFYLFSVVATGIYINWSIAGCILLLLLFKGSSDFSEGISEGKYPKYKEYQSRVGRFLPKLQNQKEENVGRNEALPEM